MKRVGVAAVGVPAAGEGQGLAGGCDLNPAAERVQVPSRGPVAADSAAPGHPGDSGRVDLHVVGVVGLAVVAAGVDRVRTGLRVGGIADVHPEHGAPDPVAGLSEADTGPAVHRKSQRSMQVVVCPAGWKKKPTAACRAGSTRPARGPRRPVRGRARPALRRWRSGRER